MRPCLQGCMWAHARFEKVNGWHTTTDIETKTSRLDDESGGEKQPVNAHFGWRIVKIMERQASTDLLADSGLPHISVNSVSDR